MVKPLAIPPRPARKVTEATIESQIREALGALPDVRLWLNEVGVDELRTGRWIHYGLANGSADLIGMLAPHGRFLSIEVKKPGGRVRSDQFAWAKMIVAAGGFAALVRGVDDAIEAIEAARRGESHFGFDASLF